MDKRRKTRWLRQALKDLAAFGLKGRLHSMGGGSSHHQHRSVYGGSGGIHSSSASNAANALRRGLASKAAATASSQAASALYRSLSAGSGSSGGDVGAGLGGSSRHTTPSNSALNSLDSDLVVLHQTQSSAGGGGGARHPGHAFDHIVHTHVAADVVAQHHNDRPRRDIVAATYNALMADVIEDPGWSDKLSKSGGGGGGAHGHSGPGGGHAVHHTHLKKFAHVRSSGTAKGPQRDGSASHLTAAAAYSKDHAKIPGPGAYNIDEYFRKVRTIPSSLPLSVCPQLTKTWLPQGGAAEGGGGGGVAAGAVFCCCWCVDEPDGGAAPAGRGGCR